jgi:hypothetical protein
MTPEEVHEIREFILARHTTNQIPEMEEVLERATAYAQRVGEIVNEAEQAYHLKLSEVMGELRNRDEETETSKGAALKARTASERKLLPPVSGR